MEKIKRYIPRIIILDTIICLLIITMLFFILHFFNLMFRQWIYVMFAILIILGFIIGTMQLLLKIKRKVIKISSILIFIIILLLSSPIAYLGIVFGYMPEHVIERDEKKYDESENVLSIDENKIIE